MFALVCFLLALPAAETVRLGNDVVPVRQALTFKADPRGETYRGSVRIELEVKKATRIVRLHAKELTFTAMTLAQGKRSIPVEHAPGEDDTLVVTAAEALQPGRAVLSIDFTREYTLPESGFCKVKAADGEPMLVTDFEPVDARGIFPVFDEPRFKIPWDVAAEIPADYDAVSNAPVESESRTGSTKTIRFRRTKPLPSYLVTLAVGKFDYTPIAGTSVPARIVSPRGQGRLAGIAAEVTPRILHALEAFFGSRYPFEKLDLIVVPEFSHAMENAGAITFGERYISLDPATVTPAQRAFMIKLIAHETAHMWFGDLVTMEWWDDVWLNESFADWLGDKVAREQFPESASQLEELTRVQGAMTTDARASTNSTRMHNVAPSQVFSNYATIYLKGKAVLAMSEAWMGGEKFRQGVLDHIRSHAGGNANADDFFAALGRHAPPATAAALRSFVDLPGIPLVTVELTEGGGTPPDQPPGRRRSTAGNARSTAGNAGVPAGNARSTAGNAGVPAGNARSTAGNARSTAGNAGVPAGWTGGVPPPTITLRQSRFTTSPNPLPPQTWKIPVSIRYSDGTATRNATVLLDAPSKTIRLEGERIEWLFPHATATGYYRWNGPAEWLDTLSRRSGELLAPEERLAFIGNLAALVRAGAIHGDAYVELLGRFANDASPEVIQALIAAFNDLRLPFETAATRTQLASYFRSTLHTALEQIGLTPKPGESLAITTVRPDLLSFLGVFGDDESVRQFAREQLARYRANPASVPPSLVDAVLSINADRGDEALFDEMRKRFEAATAPTDRRMFARVLGRFHDPEVKKKARAYALSTATRWNEITAVAGLPVSEEERAGFYEWATANYAELAKRYSQPVLSTLPFIADGCEPERIAAARQFFAAHQVDGTARQLERTAEQVAECAALRSRELELVAKALSSRQ